MTAVNPPPATISEPVLVIEFRPLDTASVRLIAERLVEHWKKKSLHKGYPLEVGDDVLDLLCRHGHNEEQGARPMKRAVEQHLMQPLSRDILQGRLRGGDPILARVEGGRVVFQQEEYGSGP